MMTIEEAAVDRVASLRQCMRHAREDTACEGTTAEKRAERRVISCRPTPHTYFFLPDTTRTNIYILQLSTVYCSIFVRNYAMILFFSSVVVKDDNFLISIQGLPDSYGQDFHCTHWLIWV